MLEHVYAIWFYNYEEQSIVGNLYRDEIKALARCTELNEEYNGRVNKKYPRNHYCVEEHIIE